MYLGGLEPWAVNIGEHFDIIRYQGYLGDKKSNATQIIWGAKFLNTRLCDSVRNSVQCSFIFD